MFVCSYYEHVLFNQTLFLYKSLTFGAERERALPDKHIDKMVIKTIDKYGLLFCMHFLIHIQLSCIQYVTHFGLSVKYEINMLVSGPNLPKQSFYLIRVQYILWKFQRSVININLQQIFFIFYYLLSSTHLNTF